MNGLLGPKITSWATNEQKKRPLKKKTYLILTKENIEG
jgi:hypothetical protein